VAGSSERGNASSVSIKWEEFCDYLRNYDISRRIIQGYHKEIDTFSVM
jgi:hypothetical protein